jgi:hypothetical protein
MHPARRPDRHSKELNMSATKRLNRWCLAIVAMLAAAAVVAPATAQCTPSLDDGPRFPFQEPGSNDQIFCSTTWDPDGAGYQRERLVVGGIFTSIGGTPANRVAAWNGSRWEQLGLGAGGGFNSAVYAVKVFNGQLYAAGAFTSANGVAINHVARYNASTNTWVSVGNGFNGDVRALEVHQGELYAGGFFTSSGATTINRVARLVGSSWVALSGGGVNGNVFCLSSDSGIGGPMLYVGGTFTTAGSGGSLVQARNVARWNATSIWQPLGGGTDGIVLAIRGGMVGGAFNNVFTSDGTAIPSPGVGVFLCPTSTCGLWLSGVNFPGGQVYALHGDSTAMYAAGGGLGTHLCYRYSGGTWTPVGSGYTGSFYGFTLTTYENELVMGGLFPNMILGPGLHNLTRFHNGAWDSVRPHVNGPVRVFTAFNGRIVAGGAMDQSASDGTRAAGIITADPSIDPTFFGTYGVINGTVSSLFVSSNGITLATLYAGGTFSSAGVATNVNNIAAWSGPIGPGGPEANWAAVGGGILNENPGGVAQVLALTGYGMQGFGINRSPILHAGGVFTRAGNNTCRNVARYLSGAWQPLGGGVSSTSGAEMVRCFANYGGNLVAAGLFDAANNTGGPVTANSIASWNGTDWSALGSGATAGLRNQGTKGNVASLAVFGGSLVAGGVFDTAGGVACRNVARWDGTAWHDMSAGIPSIGDEVAALGVLYSRLYCATNTPNGSSGGPEARVYRWEGSSWAQVGEGFAQGSVHAMFAYGNRLHVGGSFPLFPGADSANWIEVLCTCAGDINGDGQVTPADVAEAINIWSSSLAGGTLAGDFDGNGLVQPADIAFFVNAWAAAVATGC